MNYIEFIGYAVCYIGGAGVVVSLLIGICVLSNRLQHAFISSLGGWKVFLIYRDWLADEEHKKFVAKMQSRVQKPETT